MLDSESTSDDSGLPDIPSGDEGVPAPVVHEMGDSPRSPSILEDQGNRDEPVEYLCDSDSSTILYISHINLYFLFRKKKQIVTSQQY